MTGVTFSRSCYKNRSAIQPLLASVAHRRLGRTGLAVARLDNRGAVLLAEHHTGGTINRHVGDGVLDQNFFELTSYCGLHLKLIREAAA